MLVIRPRASSLASTSRSFEARCCRTSVAAVAKPCTSREASSRGGPRTRPSSSVNSSVPASVSSMLRRFPFPTRSSFSQAPVLWRAHTGPASRTSSGPTPMHCSRSSSLLNPTLVTRGTSAASLGMTYHPFFCPREPRALRGRAGGGDREDGTRALRTAESLVKLRILPRPANPRVRRGLEERRPGADDLGTSDVHKEVEDADRVCTRRPQGGRRCRSRLSRTPRLPPLSRTPGGRGTAEAHLGQRLRCDHEGGCGRRRRSHRYGSPQRR